MRMVVRVRMGPKRALMGRTKGKSALGLGMLVACAVSQGGDEEPPTQPAIGAYARARDADAGGEAREGRPVSAMSPREAEPSAEHAEGANTPDPVHSEDTELAILGVEDPIPAEAETQDGLDPADVGDPEPDEDGIDPPDVGDPEPDEDGIDPELATVGRGRAVLAPALQPLPRSRWIKHRRVPRESLTQIALRYGVREEQLREWNELEPDEPIPRKIKRLRVRARRLPPPRRRIEYTVQEGDTWWSVALRHGVDGRDLRAYNYPSRKKMQPGSTLQVWIDPVVHDWIAEGPDPLPPDLDRGMRRGAVSIGSTADGVLLNGLRIPDHEDLQLRLPRSAYGTSHAVEQLVLAVSSFREHSSYPLPIPVGSMSRPRGGPIGGHKSHQSGRDVDLRLLRRPDVPAWKETRGSRVQWDAVWQLVLAFSEVDVMVIFLDYKAQRRLYRAAKAAGASEDELDALIQYPRGSRASRGLVRHSSGHEQHLHVRFGCGPFEPECVP